MMGLVAWVVLGTDQSKPSSRFFPLTRFSDLHLLVFLSSSRLIKTSGVSVMWPTSDGDRTLQGSEAILLANTIDVMLDRLVDYTCCDEEEHQEIYAAVCQTGVSVFDSLAISQRIAVLHHAAVQLLTDAPFPSEALCAIDDATVAAIYAEVRDQIEIEFDMSDSFNDIVADFESSDDDDFEEDMLFDLQWRRLVHNACLEVLDEGEWTNVSSDADLASVEMGEWELWVDCLASAILWDRDFEFADTFLDADPEIVRQRRRTLGISDDYFVMPAPDPSGDKLEALVEATRKLVRSIYCKSEPSDWQKLIDPDSPDIPF